MGKKINPLLFRLETTQSHHSLWFEQPKNYPKGLQEDKKIRDSIKNYVQKNRRKSYVIEGITCIKIKKGIDLIEVIIYTGLPKLLIERKPRRIEKLEKNVQKELELEKKQKELEKNVQKELEKDLKKEINCVSRKLNITIRRIAKPYGHPNILAEFIARQLKSRVSFRKAMKKAIKLTEEAGTNGVKIQIAGRIGGKDIARVEWTRRGRVPLQTVRANIDYCSYPVRTIYGILGIKIWKFVNK